jgi:NAD-dependent dihydropyrimidine dehydrogenase PreA subunit
MPTMSEAKTRGWVVIDGEECKGCALCVAICPAGCLVILPTLNHQGYHPAAYTGDGCRADGLCFYACPEPGAIACYKGDPEERDHA